MARRYMERSVIHQDTDSFTCHQKRSSVCPYGPPLTLNPRLLPFSPVSSSDPIGWLTDTLDPDTPILDPLLLCRKYGRSARRYRTRPRMYKHDPCGITCCGPCA